MRRYVLALGLALCAALPAAASLAPGTSAPDFRAEATQGGKVFVFDLRRALARGPVVLYFYPAAFTPGCTIEAHEFAQAIDEYRRMHATVIGVSHDDVPTLRRFSVSECRSKFAVAADTRLVIAKKYDAVLAADPRLADRTSYVIAPDGRILYTYTDLNPTQHVRNTLAALRSWEERGGK